MGNGMDKLMFAANSALGGLSDDGPDGYHDGDDHEGQDADADEFVALGRGHG